ncbi:MAG TPA: hypothetical protein VNR64_03740 [Vicinamibacterales bacterium]|nr:hypothetical protein [Vicinamibacterales bacterium]
MLITRKERIALLDALDQRVKQFRRSDDISPFRRPHDPLDLLSLIPSVLSDLSIASAVDALRSRTVIRMEWPDGGAWEAWVATLPSGIHAYFDTDGTEHRLLASVKRGSAIEADRFFVELLAESRGHHFGIEMHGGAPARIRTSLDDREWLADIFVELFEGTEAEGQIQSTASGGVSGDFRVDVERWMADVLVSRGPSARSRRYPRLREAE